MFRLNEMKENIKALVSLISFLKTKASAHTLFVNSKLTVKLFSMSGFATV